VLSISLLAMAVVLLDQHGIGAFGPWNASSGSRSERTRALGVEFRLPAAGEHRGRGRRAPRWGRGRSRVARSSVISFVDMKGAIIAGLQSSAPP